jgi:hypothetical protein
MTIYSPSFASFEFVEPNEYLIYSSDKLVEHEIGLRLIITDKYLTTDQIHCFEVLFNHQYTKDRAYLDISVLFAQEKVFESSFYRSLNYSNRKQFKMMYVKNDSFNFDREAQSLIIRASSKEIFGFTELTLINFVGDLKPDAYFLFASLKKPP